ncbi:MAG: aminotransferase class I/II-fold pyridoxal phosphate-dependent enzyme, partial [Candidatus Cloacimonetes bacterium]|nr:aminotransferase class I/II-fold pyridoxal phosphate-dependent enzyme [Candidatus Cloacimonadota bacterium]
MSLFRDDLASKPDIKVAVATRKHNMCLNESSINPLEVISGALQDTIKKVQLNRYVSDVTPALKKKLAEYVGDDIQPPQILFGNGVDDLLYFLFTATRSTWGSYVLSLAPSYFDYQTYSGSVGLNICQIDFDQNFDFSVDKYLEKLSHPDCTLGILCNPNNPTGHMLSDEKIEAILKSTQKPILIDETYFEFSGKTYVGRLKDFPHLLISRSFSKSFSAAGLRFGYLIGSQENMVLLNRVIPVFNTSILTQAIAL